jgi:hypothetical protein
MSRRALAAMTAVAAALGVALAWWLAGGWIAERVLRPVVGALREMGSAVERWPQLIVWLVVLGFAALVATRIVLRHAAIPRRAPRRPRRVPISSDLHRLARSIARHRRAASHRHVVRELTQIAALLVAREEGVTIGEAMRSLRRGGIDAGSPALAGLQRGSGGHRTSRLAQYRAAIDELRRYAQEGRRPWS